MLKAAVIGDPIAHSLSPKIHNFFLKKFGIDGSYEAIRVEKENLSQAVQSLIDQGFKGFNVTLPHKEEIFKICDFVSKTASATGAVNTVVITSDKKIFGHNSDADGFLNNLLNQAPELDLQGGTAFVIGAGGAARAVIYSLIKLGAKKIFIGNRNQSRALELIKNFSEICAKKNCSLEFLSKNNFAAKLDLCDLLVNSTSLGMENQEPLDLDLSLLKKSAIVCDIVYKPLQTELLKLASARGNKTVDGLGMLICQALVGFELWFGKKPEAKDLAIISSQLIDTN